MHFSQAHLSFCHHLRNIISFSTISFFSCHHMPVCTITLTSGLASSSLVLYAALAGPRGALQCVVHHRLAIEISHHSFPSLLRTLCYSLTDECLGMSRKGKKVFKINLVISYRRNIKKPIFQNLD